MSRRIGNIIAWALIAVTVAGMGIMWIFTPENCDDLWFKSEYRDCIAAGLSPLAAVAEVVRIHSVDDNVRLANILFIIQLMCGLEWLAGVVLTAAWAAMFVYLRRIYKALCSLPLALAMTILAMLSLLPWEEFMFSHDFAFNYILPSALSVLSVYYFYNIDNVSGRGRIASVYILFLITGFMHEAFALPLLVGMCGYIILFARHSRRAFMAALCMLPGLIVLFSFAFSSRYDSIGGLAMFGSRPLGMWFKVCVAVGVGILVFLSVALLLRRNITSRLRLLTLMSFVILSAVIIRIAIPNGDRAGWCGLLFMIVAAAILICPRIIDEWRWSHVCACLVSVVILAGVGVHFVSTTVDTFRLRSWYFPAREAYARSTDMQIFCDIKGLKDYSRLSFGRPFRWLTLPGYNMERLALYYRGEGAHCVFFPKAFENVDIEPGRKVPGNSPFYEKDGFLYCPADSLDFEEATHWNVDGIGMGLYLEPFNVSGGSRYYWAYSQSVSFSKLPAYCISR